ncbi:MAG: hypothetical protein MZW92_34480 [Comamonadaceae bacterium]|nr:hypothetical protein [Comamonadaceae bacterium]
MAATMAALPHGHIARWMKLHIITTGGTIDKIYVDAKSDYQVQVNR